MHSNGTLLLDVLLDAPLDARCVYALSHVLTPCLDLSVGCYVLWPHIGGYIVFAMQKSYQNFFTQKKE